MKTKEELVKYLRDGNTVKYLFFWGHTQKSESIDKSCLSQWFPSSFKENSISYASAEHYMMAKKAELFQDKEVLLKILTSKSPAEAKKWGREVRGFKNKVWDENSFGYVVQGNVLKFGQNLLLRNFLMNSGRRILVEASPNDRVWGIGLAARDAFAQRPSKWCGDNHLGFALMEARRILGEGI